MSQSFEVSVMRWKIQLYHLAVNGCPYCITLAGPPNFDASMVSCARLAPNTMKIAPRLYTKSD